MICIDNDILRKYAGDSPDPAVVNYLSSRKDDAWCISSIVLFEFLQHYDTDKEVRHRQRQLDQVIDEVFDLDAGVVVTGVGLQNTLSKADTSLDRADLLIAATAHHHGATLATANENDFDTEPIRQLLDVDVLDPS